ncbi:MAG: KH domain-containing protein [Anaerolineales bacterium]|jgi:predicted RNA-binding protein YlqC (UPF0109 family)
MRELIEYIASSLVDDPSQIEIRQFRRGSQITFKLRVAREDMGRIIGKSGRVANSIRTLLRVSSAREGKRAALDIVEPR